MLCTLVFMSKPYTIGRLAAFAGVPTSTVRYYERVGLLKAQGRTASNYRFYDDEALKQLRFIRAAQATGFALEDIEILLELRSGSLEPCKEVQELLTERLAAVETRLSDLRRVKQVLRAKLNECKKADEDEKCRVLDQLSLTASGS